MTSPATDYTESVVPPTGAEPNYSPWLPPTQAEYAQAVTEVDRRKHPGAVWWDGTLCVLIRDDGCDIGFGISTDHADYVERIARHLAWHNRGEQ